MDKKPITNAKGEEIVFRRIRGRVVPIKRKASSAGRAPKRKESKAAGAAKAGGMFSTGVFGGLFSGSVFAEFGKESERARDASKTLFKRAQHINAEEKWLRAKTKQKGGPTMVFSPRTGIGAGEPEFLKRQARFTRRSAAKQRLRSIRLSKQGFAVGAWAFSLGVFLASQGIRRGLETFDKDKKLNIGQEAVSDIGAAVVVGAAANELAYKRGVTRKAAAKLIKKILSKGRL